MDKDNNSSGRRRGAHAAPAKAPPAGRTAKGEKTRKRASAPESPVTPAPSGGAGSGERSARETDRELKAREKAQAKAEKQRVKALKAAAAKPARKKNLKRLTVTLTVVLVLAVLAAVGAAMGGYYVSNNGVNFPNVFIGETPVGGLSRDETLQLLASQGWDERVNTAMRVRLPAHTILKLDLRDAGAVLTKEAAANAAYRYGHGANLFSNLFVYLENLVRPVDVASFTADLDQDYIHSRARSGIEKFLRNTAGSGEPYEIDQDQQLLRLVKGAGEMEIDLESLCTQISAALVAGQAELIYDHIDNELVMPDFDAIHAELGREPQDAHFAQENFEIVDEVVGCAFDVQQAQSLWQAAQPGEEIDIPLIITYPEITAEDLRGMLFRDRLGAMTTNYSGSTDARVNNIHLAVSKINDLVLMPGEEFSYNGTVGQRTEEAGFQAADAYADGEVVQEVGGGICQVSSTLYCATLYAQLETVSRTNHYFKVGYLDYGMDATVSWQKPDFKFRNSRDYPVKIVAYCDDEYNELTIEIWGTDTDGTYVTLRHSSFVIYDEEYTDVVVAHAIQNYRDIHNADGDVIDTVKGPYDIYNLHDYDIAWPEEKYEKDEKENGGGDDEEDDPVVQIPMPPDLGGGFVSDSDLNDPYT